MSRAASRAAALASSALARESAAASAQAASSSSRGGLQLVREASLRARHGTLSVGVDEAGRGPLAGPVVAAAVAVLRSGGPPPVAGVRDSKTVPEEEREALAAALRASKDIEFAIAVVPVSTIDSINILQATLRGMETAVAAVARQVAERRLRGGGDGVGGKDDVGDLYVLIDGPIAPPGLAAAAGSYSASAAAGSASGGVPVRFVEPVIKGDSKLWCIAAASLLAKAHRDGIMRELDKAHPQYGFGVHKGYGVAAHMAALQKHGPCAAHRRTFQPVKSMLLLTATDAGAGAPAAAPAGAKRSRAAAAAGVAAAAPPPPKVPPQSAAPKRSRIAAAKAPSLESAAPAAAPKRLKAR